MKKKKNILLRFIPILLFSTLVGVVCFFIGKKIGLNTDTTKTNTNIEDVEVEKRTINKKLSANGSVEASETEKLTFNTSYYYDSINYEEGDIVKKGEKLLKYTNGNYYEAPYDLVISKISLPSSGSKITTSNYIEVYNVEDVLINININESEISSISLGQEVNITLNADTNKKYTGEISKISSVGNYSTSGTTFPITVKLENDGDIKLGMSVSCEINIEEKDDVLTVPIGAVQINGDRKYVVVVDGDNTKEVDVETGLSDDSYVEIKSGLSEGDKVRVVTITKQSTIRSSKNSNSIGGNSGSRPSFNGGNMPDTKNMPNMKGNRPN